MVRFKKCMFRYEAPTEFSPRRRAAAARAIDKQKAKAGMFVDQYKFETVDERLEHREDTWSDWVKNFRHETAISWVSGRQALFKLLPPVRRELIDEWNRRTWIPGSSEYFLDFLRSRGVIITKERTAR